MIHVDTRRFRHRRMLIISALIGVLISVYPPLPARAAGRASVELSPASKVVQVDETFRVDVVVSTNESVNAVDTNLSFPPSLLMVTEIETDQSWVTIWIPGSPSFSNKDGTIRFRGGRPTPGIQGKGTIATVVFQAKRPGKANVAFGDSRLLANDGLGTDVLEQTKDGTYVLATVAEGPPPLVIFVPRPGAPPVPIAIPREILAALIILWWLLLLLLLYYLWKRYREWRRKRRR